MTVRNHGYVAFDTRGDRQGGWRVWRARGKTFLVEWFEPAEPGATLAWSCADEAIAVVMGDSATIGAERTPAPRRSLVVLPAGPSELALSDGALILLSPIRPGAPRALAANEADYDDSTAEGMRAAGAAAQPAGLQVIPVDAIVPPADKPRLKIVRSASMSVSWIEYEGVRDRTKLSPHDHADFEQGSLAVEGAFIHHLRTPWGPDATAWRDDVHLAAAPRSLAVIPPRMLHTTEGEGGGRHVLVDVFAPARADFVAKGWVFNADRYAAADQASNP